MHIQGLPFENKRRSKNQSRHTK